VKSIKKASTPRVKSIPKVRNIMKVQALKKVKDPNDLQGL
jgi:hypothetical protein